MSEVMSDFDIESISDEQLDLVADTAIEALRSILAYFDVENAHIEEYEGDDQEIILDVVDGNLAILIGRHGTTLDALQLMVSTMVFKKLGFRYPVTIDVESYKHRQRQKIESIAENAANKAVRQDRNIKLRPMNAYERRIVHITLREDNRVETISEGLEPNRFVVVKPL